MVVGADHAACAKGFTLAIISTTVETSEPEKELAVAFEITGEPLEKFVTISPNYVPVTTGKEDQVFITSSLDATSNFESAAKDVLRIYKNITGKELDLTNLPEEIEG